MRTRREVVNIQVDGRRRREINRAERGRQEYERMIARYDSECKLTAHYFIDLETGEPINIEEDCPDE